LSKRRWEETKERNYRRTKVRADGNNRLGKVSNRRWEKTEEWQLWQER
jgi:hypothetical protein